MAFVGSRRDGVEDAVDEQLRRTLPGLVVVGRGVAGEREGRPRGAGEVAVREGDQVGRLLRKRGLGPRAVGQRERGQEKQGKEPFHGVKSPLRGLMWRFAPKWS